jgi:hypothetical protein
MDKLSLPCTYQELLIQLELNNVEPDIMRELKERFEEEYQGEELISENSFEEANQYFDEEFYHKDEY